MTKQQQISLMIIKKIAEGMTPVDACKAIIGADKVDAMISDLYEALKAKAA